MARPNRHRRQQKAQLPCYLPAALVAAELADLEPGKVYVLEVRHDDSCSLLAGLGPCDCKPEVRPPQPLDGGN
jgi:hypothetical protein